MNINIKEVGWFGLVSMVVGMVLFFIALLWDKIVGVQITHNEGFGYMQILALGGSGLYSFWAWTVNAKWRDYLKKVHGMNKHNGGGI